MYINFGTFPEVRVFALNKVNFPAVADIKRYFGSGLKQNNYLFDLLKMRFTCVDNTLVYFQYESKIIASAITDAPREAMLKIKEGSIREFSDYGIPTAELGQYGVKGIGGNPINRPASQGALKIDPESITLLESMINAITNLEADEHGQPSLKGDMSEDAQDLVNRIIIMESETTINNDESVFSEIGPAHGNNKQNTKRNFYPSNRSSACCPMAEFAAIRRLYPTLPSPWGPKRILNYIIDSLIKHMSNCPGTQKVLILTEFWNDTECPRLLRWVHMIRQIYPNVKIEGYLRVGKGCMQIF